VIQTGTIAAVGVFAKFTAQFIPIVSDKNILYEIGDF
jgi:APA family basic amino acid/polyamine antiporter